MNDVIGSSRLCSQFPTLRSRLKSLRGFNDSNFTASFGGILSMPRTEVSPSEWIHVRLALVEALDGFKDLFPGQFTCDGEIIVNYCSLETLLIQVRSEC